MWKSGFKSGAENPSWKGGVSKDLEHKRKHNQEYRLKPENKERRDEWLKANPESRTKHRKLINFRRKEDKRLVFEHYGAFCAWCGETDLDCLTLDHINGGGSKQKRELGNRQQIYKWVIKNNFPNDFQILCFNCNCGRKAKGRTKPEIKQ